MTLKNIIKNKDVSEIRKIAKEKTIADIASLLEDLSTSEHVLFFRLLDTEQQSKIFASLEPEYQEKLIQAFTDKEIGEIVGELFISDLADLIEDVPEELAKRILENTNKDTRASVNTILRYDDDHTGSVMTIDIITLKESWTVKKAINFIKKNKKDAELSHYYFIVDSKGKLVGRIVVEDLLFENEDVQLKTFVKPSSYVYTTTDKEAAAMTFATQDKSVLPVLNESEVVIGAITSDDVIDIIQDEATEDIQKMAGIAGDGDGLYSKMSIRKIFRSRILWLMLLMLSATLSQIVLDAFQGFSSNLLDHGKINAGSSIIWTTAIVAILPVISGAAGNAGSQSSTTIIRALSVGDITPKEYGKVFWKELRVSTCIGFVLGVANFLRLLIYFAIKNELSEGELFLSMAASISLFTVIILAKIAGGMLPLLAKKVKLDPAVMAAPLLTTLIDALSTAIFFGISIGIMVLVL